MSIFKACDIRGVYPDAIGRDMAHAIGRGIGGELAGRSCVVGGDLRPSTPELKAALTDGLKRAGVRVIDVGLAPTPTIYWARRHLGVCAGVIVTASHNPPQYNGVKFMVGEHPAGPEDLERLERRVRERDFTDGAGSVDQRDVRDDYLGWLRQRFADTGKGLRVLVDAGNGCAAQWAPDGMRQAGYEVETLFCEPDGTFPNRSPNPSESNALAAAGRAAAELGVDFAVCFDGDADRAVFLDGSGDPIGGDRAIILLARDALAAEPGSAVVYDLKCTRRVAEEIEGAGGRPLAERSGYAFIKERMLAEDAAFAGEASGHLFFRELGGDDALYAAMRMGDLIRRTGRSLRRLAATVPPYHVSPDVRIPRPKGDGQAVIDHLAKMFAGRPMIFTDGVRIEFDDGWALCRQSVTEPVISLRFEGDTPEALAAIQERVLAEIPDGDR